MSACVRILGGLLAGAATAAVALAAVSKARTVASLAESAAGVEAPSKPEDQKVLESLRIQVKEAEDRAAEEDAAAARAESPSGRAGVAAAALAKALKAGAGPLEAGKAARLVAHLLGRLRYEYQLADEELLVAPLRDRMVPDFLAGMGFSFTPDQQKKFDELLAFEDRSWDDRLEARGRETPVERVAASLDLALREEERLEGILTPQQQSTLLAQPVGGKPAENVCMVGRRWVPAGRAFDPRQENAGETLAKLWSEETGVIEGGTRFAKYSETYAEKLRELGPAPIDSTGSISLFWRRRQAMMQAEVQRGMLNDGEFSEGDRARIRKWLTADVWRDE